MFLDSDQFSVGGDTLLSQIKAYDKLSTESRRLEGLRAAHFAIEQADYPRKGRRPFEEGTCRN